MNKIWNPCITRGLKSDVQGIPNVIKLRSSLAVDGWGLVLSLPRAGFDFWLGN